MKNKLIFIILIGIFFSGLSLMALEFKTSSTSGGSWTDDNVGMNYISYGKKRYSFKKRTKQFTPWFKGRPPSVKAGCGGVSLDGGFSAFLGLEEIGKQLETAISSAGMGVIVVLVQTLPSIGKAFEDIQKLVRKIQSMLQSACQLTVASLAKNDSIDSAKTSMANAVKRNNGSEWMTEDMKGAATWLDSAMQAANCPDDDVNCYQNLQSDLFKQAINKNIPSKRLYNDSCMGNIDKNTCNAINRELGEEVKVSLTSFSKVLEEGKFGDKDLHLEPIDLTMMKLKYAIFGLLAVDESVSLTKYIDSDGKIKKDSPLVHMASNNVLSPVSLKLNWIEPENKTSDILKFLTGGSDINGSDTRKLLISNNIRLVSAKYCPKASKDGGCESKLVSISYLEETKIKVPLIEFEWEGLYKNTYKTIMHKINPSNVAPTVPVGVFLPQGSKYVEYIKNFTGQRNSPSAQYYADILARTNVIFAIKFLINEIEQDAMQLDINNNNKDVIRLYLNNAHKIVNNLKEQMVDYPGDVVYLDHLQNVFNELERQNRIRRHGQQGN